MRNAGVNFLPSKVRWWILSALVLYVGFLAASVPASVVASALAHATDGALVLEGTSGGLWQGHARSIRLVDPSGRAHSFKRPHWKSVGARLLNGEFVVRLELDDASLRGTANLTLRSDYVRVTDAELLAPASLLAQEAPTLLPLRVSGDITLQAREIILTRGGLHGVATVEWHDAQAGFDQVKSLGHYRALVNGSGARLEFQLETLGGPVRLEGRGAWSKGQPLTFEGSAHAEPGQNALLADFLSILGPHVAGNMRKVRISRPQ